MKLQLKIYGNYYKDADCEKRLEYANTLTAMIHAYLNTSGLKITRVLPCMRFLPLWQLHVLKLAYELDWFLHLCCLSVLKLSACVQLVGQWHSLAWYLSTGSLSFWFLYCTSTLRTFPSSILWKGSRYNSELLVAAYLVVILDKYHIPYWFVASCSVPLLTHNQTRKEISGTLLPKSVYDAFNELIAMFGVTCLPEMATWYPWPVWPTPAGDRSDKGKGHHLVSRS